MNFHPYIMLFKLFMKENDGQIMHQIHNCIPKRIHYNWAEQACDLTKTTFTQIQATQLFTLIY